MRAQVKSFIKALFLMFSKICRTLGLARFEARDGFTSRQDLLARLQESESVLEIGPFDQPIMRGARTKYFDIMDQQALVDRARACGRNHENCPYIDYVSDCGDLSVISGEKFDSVISAHCIEHQPDLVRHLNQVSDILRPGGRYFVIVPDKRFIFDHYAPLTRVSAVIAAHVEARQVHSAASVITHYAETTHNNPLRHWLGFHRPPAASAPYVERLQAALKMLNTSRANYIDVHSWFFTPCNFLVILKALSRTGMIGLDLERVYGTAFGSSEFYAVLRKKSAGEPARDSSAGAEDDGFINCGP